MATQNDIEQSLSIASEQELEYWAHQICNYAMSHPEMSDEEQLCGAYMLHLIAEEAERRQVEPLWRKAKRFAVRNSQAFKQVGKVAACIGAGVILGISLDD